MRERERMYRGEVRKEKLSERNRRGRKEEKRERGEEDREDK